MGNEQSHPKTEQPSRKYDEDHKEWYESSPHMKSEKQKCAEARGRELARDLRRFQTSMENHAKFRENVSQREDRRRETAGREKACERSVVTVREESMGSEGGG